VLNIALTEIKVIKSPCIAELLAKYYNIIKLVQIHEKKKKKKFSLSIRRERNGNAIDTGTIKSSEIINNYFK